MRRNKSERLTFILCIVYRTLKKIEKLVEDWNPVMRKLRMRWLYGLDALKGNIYIDVLCANEVSGVGRLYECLHTCSWYEAKVIVLARVMERERV